VSAPPSRRPVVPVRTLAVGPDGIVRDRPDDLAGEEPLEIRVEAPGQAPRAVAVTMRTVGHDFELAVGFLVTEGVVAAPDDVASARYCDVAEGAEQQYNIVTVALRGGVDLDAVARSTYTTSSCGICGKAALDAVEIRCDGLTAEATDTRLALSTLLVLPERLRAAQTVFERTGGLHAAGLFAFDGHAEIVREDVGRHNAIDKVVGRAVLDGRLPIAERALAVSGRASFEVVQKAAVAGIPVIVAVSAPTSLAVDAARRLGVTLAGFVRGDSANIYAHPERIDLDQ